MHIGPGADPPLSVSYVGRTPVEWELAESSGDTTKVAVRNWGFRGEDVVGQAIDSTQGFSFMLGVQTRWGFLLPICPSAPIDCTSGTACLKWVFPMEIAQDANAGERLR